MVSGLTGCRVSDKELGYRERANAILADVPTVDLHTHGPALEGRGIDDGVFPYAGDRWLRPFFAEMLVGGLKGGYFCVTSDWRHMDTQMNFRPFEPGEAWSDYERQIAIFGELLERQELPIELARRADDLERIASEGKVAVYISTEGGHMIEDDLGRLEQLQQDGVCTLQPIHYVGSALGDSQTLPPTFGGLSDLGKEAVREASRLGLIVDAAHASLECASHMAEVAGKPIVLSHTMMMYEGGNNHERWISADHARLVAETGGVIGTWAVPSLGSADDYVDATLRIMETAGVDHVGWSTDWVPVLRGSPVLSSYEQLPAIAAKFLEKGLSESDLAKFLGGNALRVHRQVAG